MSEEIYPEGVMKSGKKKLSLTGVEVKEFGFSRALMDDFCDDLSLLEKYVFSGINSFY